MRVYAVTPIHVPRRSSAPAGALRPASPPGLAVELHDIGAARAARAGHRAGGTRVRGAASPRRCARPRPGYDAFLPDCVLDPGVADLQGRSSRRPCSACCGSPSATWSPRAAVRRGHPQPGDRRRARRPSPRRTGSAGRFTGGRGAGPRRRRHRRGRPLGDAARRRRGRTRRRRARDLVVNGCSAVDLPTPPTRARARGRPDRAGAAAAWRPGRRDERRAVPTSSSPVPAAGSSAALRAAEPVSTSWSSRPASTSGAATTPRCRPRWCPAPARAGRREAGIDDSPELFVADITRQDPRPGATSGWPRALAERQRRPGRVARRLRSGCRCRSSPTSTTPATRSTACHTIPGRHGTG